MSTKKVNVLLEVLVESITLKTFHEAQQLTLLWKGREQTTNAKSLKSDPNLFDAEAHQVSFHHKFKL